MTAKTRNMPLPNTAAETQPDNPWPLRLLSTKLGQHITNAPTAWIEGEIITFTRRPNAKVQFFTLADLEEKVSISVKMFSYKLPESIESGSHVVIYAKPDFWREQGSLTLHADEIRTVGLGDWLEKIERLKKQLASEGLFDKSRKQPLPFIPNKIGLICGRNTQAKHDVLENTELRWPGTKFEIREVQVQGNGSVHAMLGALTELDALPEVDVIIMARGGGSVEDLLPFSQEELLRAVASAHTPIVSAIGHETDNPLLDFVADVRASTPTDATAKVVPSLQEETNKIAYALQRCRQITHSQLTQAEIEIANIRSKPIFTKPTTLIDTRIDDLTNIKNWARFHFEKNLHFHSSTLEKNIAQLRALSPQSTLKRGYSILLKADGTVVNDVTDTPTETPLIGKLYNGELNLIVVNKQRKDNHE